MSLVSSQGANLLDGYMCTNVKISTSSSEGGGGGANKVDVSHLGLAHGSDRVFADAPLRDPNAAAADEDGNTTTITVTYYGASQYPVGGQTTISGITVKCTQSEVEYAVGEYVKGTATFVSVPAGEAA